MQETKTQSPNHSSHLLAPGECLPTAKILSRQGSGPAYHDSHISAATALQTTGLSTLEAESLSRPKAGFYSPTVPSA